MVRELTKELINKRETTTEKFTRYLAMYLRGNADASQLKSWCKSNLETLQQYDKLIETPKQAQILAETKLIVHEVFMHVIEIEDRKEVFI